MMDERLSADEINKLVPAIARVWEVRMRPHRRDLRAAYAEAWARYKEDRKWDDLLQSRKIAMAANKAATKLLTDDYFLVLNLLDVDARRGTQEMEKALTRKIRRAEQWLDYNNARGLGLDGEGLTFGEWCAENRRRKTEKGECKRCQAQSKSGGRTFDIIHL